MVIRIWVVFQQMIKCEREDRSCKGGLEAIFGYVKKISDSTGVWVKRALNILVAHYESF